jgi:PKD repeat protein
MITQCSKQARKKQSQQTTIFTLNQNKWQLNLCKISKLVFLHTDGITGSKSTWWRWDINTAIVTDTHGRYITIKALEWSCYMERETTNRVTDYTTTMLTIWQAIQ